MKEVSVIMISMCFLATTSFNLIPVGYSSTARVYVDPSSVTNPELTPGSDFTVDVKVSDVYAQFGCYVWQVNMSFDSNILECTSITEGEFLKDQPEGTIGLYRIEESWALFSWTTVGKYLGVNGSGTLATVEFLVRGMGESVINIDHPLTWLLEMIPAPVPPGEDPFRDIPCVTENGFFSNLGGAISTAVYFNLHPNPVGFGEILTLKGILIDESSQPLTNENVALYARPLTGSWRYITSVATNAFGIFMWQVTIPGTVTPGTYMFAVYYPGSEMYESTHNLAILVI